MPVVTKISYSDIKWRINPKRRPPKRHKTELDTFDEWTGGIPYGLTIIYGTAGCGKSLLARTISTLSKGCIYLACEVQSDAPENLDNVIMVDYTTHKPNYKRALNELDLLIEHLEPELVIIDSLTSFLSVTNMGEADLRKGVSPIHTQYEGKIPIIGISEVRGNGYNRSTAGGEGVKHACSMLIEMEHEIIQFPSIAESYGMDIGDDVYTLRVVKDKHNISNTKSAKVILKNNIPQLFSLLPESPGFKKKGFGKPKETKTGWQG